MILSTFLHEKHLEVFQQHRSFKAQFCQHGLFLFTSKAAKLEEMT